MASNGSVRRLVTMFESRVAAVRTATRAPAAISRSRVHALVRFYGPTSTIASTSIEAIDAVRFAAFSNPHDPAAAADIDPRWSIQVIDSARFAEFQNPHASSEINFSVARRAASCLASDQHSLDNEPEAAIVELEQTRSAEPFFTADNGPQAPQFDNSKWSVKGDKNDFKRLQYAASAAVPRSAADRSQTILDTTNKLAFKELQKPNPGEDVDDKSYSQLLQVQEVTALLRRTTPVAAVVEPLPLLKPRPLRASTSRVRPQHTKSRLFDFKHNSTFVRQCAQARQRRAAAAATPRNPTWKL